MENGNKNHAHKKTAIIIGAGPAGLTAAYELLEKTDIKPIVYEMSDDVGGISKTINYKGNRIDIGGHRFFSKSDRVMKWWENILPIQGYSSKEETDLNKNHYNSHVLASIDKIGPDPEKEDRVLLIRRRLSKIFFQRKLFNYPVSFNLNTLTKLGLIKTLKIVFSYVKSVISPIRPEKSFEDFLINRFGKELYHIFFKDYTEKVWGTSCDNIAAEWGVQRVKGLSITKVIVHAIKNIFSGNSSISQKNTETSLIEKFLYPKYGPGQMWKEVAAIVKERGGEIHYGWKAIGFKYEDNKVLSTVLKSLKNNKEISVKGDYFFSTMPVKELISSMGNDVPQNVQNVAQGLVYRDFIMIGLLLNKLKLKDDKDQKTISGIVPYNWIYIQEREVKIGRLQIYNNWSPYMVKERNKVWIGLEYFCNEGDEQWAKQDNDFIQFAIDELAKINIIDINNVLDATIIRMPKAYPALFGTYDQFHIIRDFTDKFENLFLIGRNGMHKYNNQDHSMLTAMTAVDNIINNFKSKDNVWMINTEQDYHENK